MTAWTANTDTFGMSEYEPFAVTCPAVIDGKLYAVTDDGIVEFNDDDRQPQDFDSAIEWGMEDFGTAELKRPSYVYIAYESFDVLNFTLGFVAAGYEEQAEYELPYRVADDVSAGRFKLGRGIRSRHFRVGFRSFAGYPFTLHDTRFLINTTSRRL